ncbi:Hermansky-Pudlak syndrome 1 protein [Acipenser ruthenus]|uniref:Hermansky-Pudlak syndrome 1 protein n=1 Tax=Acipenser ruthenus TaxID=7906 RepID=A0A444ULG4_ACIRT|nr:Hermansky-Pudlak syndrome 1 protein [Acipenser ruthenus]
MKCLLVASESAEVLFYWADPEFEQNIRDQYGPRQYVGDTFAECLYNGDGEESEEDLRRKIYMMKKLIEVHFGMVTLNSAPLRKE